MGFVFRSHRFARKHQSDTTLLLNIARHVRRYADAHVLDIKALTLALNDHARAYDVICSMSRDPRFLRILAIHEKRRTRIVNSTQAVLNVLNNGLVLTRLADWGIDTPRMQFLAPGESPLTYPVALKPLSRLERSLDRPLIARSSSDLRIFSDVVIAQEYISPGTILKCYVVGTRALGTCRIADTIETSEACAPSRIDLDRVQHISLRCGEVLGLEIYNVEVIVSGDKYYVIDVNDLPSFDGVPEAPEAIADFLVRICGDEG